MSSTILPNVTAGAPVRYRVWDRTSPRDPRERGLGAPDARRPACPPRSTKGAGDGAMGRSCGAGALCLRRPAEPRARRRAEARPRVLAEGARLPADRGRNGLRAAGRDLDGEPDDRGGAPLDHRPVPARSLGDPHRPADGDGDLRAAGERGRRGEPARDRGPVARRVPPGLGPGARPEALRGRRSLLPRLDGPRVRRVRAHPRAGRESSARPRASRPAAAPPASASAPSSSATTATTAPRTACLAVGGCSHAPRADGTECHASGTSAAGQCVSGGCVFP